MSEVCQLLGHHENIGHQGQGCNTQHNGGERGGPCKLSLARALPPTAARAAHRIVTFLYL